MRWRICAKRSADAWTGCSRVAPLVTRGMPILGPRALLLRAAGSATARDALAEPFADGHLLFAGEACHVGFAGTLAGAWISGQSAARTALAAIGQ